MKLFPALLVTLVTSWQRQITLKKSSMVEAYPPGLFIKPEHWLLRVCLLSLLLAVKLGDKVYSVWFPCVAIPADLELVGGGS